MTEPDLHVVTGAFGYSGQYIARRLLARGYRVRTLTNSPERLNPFHGQVEAHPYHFDRPERLAASLMGARVLYNTYWVRFNRPEFTQSAAVENTRRLFEAARQAGVERIVHVSITNPSLDSPLEYFRDKAVLEQLLRATGLEFAILRPAVLFGPEDILINNIAWVLRRLPVFGVFGNGDYCLQPIYVDDLATLAVEQGQGALQSNPTIDAIGPETFTYRGLVEELGAAIGHRRPIVSVPPTLGYWVGWAIGRLMGDVTLTRQEIQGLMDGLLCAHSPSVGTTRLSEWARQHADSLGVHYANELARRRDRRKPYSPL